MTPAKAHGAPLPASARGMFNTVQPRNLPVAFSGLRSQTSRRRTWLERGGVR